MPESGRPFLRYPSLSSDGRQIAFAYGGDLWLADASGGAASRITANPADDRNPLFSPDNTQMAFFSERINGGGIFVKNLDDPSPPRLLTSASTLQGPYCWSPDGQWLYTSGTIDGISHAICKIPSSGGSPVPMTVDPLERYYSVAVSRDAQQLAFVNNGTQFWRKQFNRFCVSDIWLTTDSCKPADFRKISTHPGKNLRPMWSSDGKGVYYLSDKGGVENIWYVPIRGRAKARQITRFTDGRVVRPAISGSGCSIVFERSFQLWILDIEKGTSQPVNIDVHADPKRNPVNRFQSRSVTELSLSEDGKKVAFISFGSVYGDLADKGDKIKKGGPSFQVSGSNGRESQLCWRPDHHRIIYRSDRDGEPQLYQYDFKSRAERRITKSGQAKAVPTVSPNGKFLAYTAGQEAIEIRRLSSGKSVARIEGYVFFGLQRPASLCWSPDSSWLAFTATDRRLFSNVYVYSVKEKKVSQLSFLSNLYASTLLWSPNGRFLVFGTRHFRYESQIARIDLVPVSPVFAEADFDQIFENSVSDDAVEKSGQNQDEPKGGKRKAASAKKPDPVKIDFADIKHRIRFLTAPDQFAFPLAIRPDSKYLIYSAVTGADRNLWSSSLEEIPQPASPQQLTYAGVGGTMGAFTPDGKKLYFLEGARIRSLVVNEDGSRKGSPSTLNTVAEIERDFAALKQQVFSEAWRLIRDHFYDPQHHGVDWSGLRDRFSPMVGHIQTQSELTELINLMLGELNASHLGASSYGSRAPETGQLGIAYDRKAMEKHGRLKITRVYRDGPLSLVEAAPQEGEYVVKIEDTRIRRGADFNSLLLRKAGRRVRIWVNSSPTLKGARKLEVLPITTGALSTLAYHNWVRENRDYVNDRSEGRLGYLHIRQMGYQDYIQFIADLDSEAYGKDGIVIDVRFNPGGFSAVFILDVLSRKAVTRSLYRNVATAAGTHLAGSRILEKPVILVTNEHSSSNAEIFSEGFRTLGIGTVVGQPTAGAVISTASYALLDNTLFRIPMFAVTTLAGENTESTGRPVDIEVDRPPGEAMSGVDRQLDAAANELLSQIPS